LAYSLTLPASLLPGNHSWLRRFETPEIADGRTVGQEFTMRRDGLDAIEFIPASNSLSPSGNIHVALIDITSPGNSQVLRTGTLRAAELVRGTYYRFAFPPIVDSRNRKYLFELAAQDVSSGITLRATKGDPYPDGTLTFNGRGRWADLMFQASAPTESIWRTLWAGGTQSGVSGKLILTLLVVNWLALGVLFHSLVSLPTSEHAPQ
jgi:hypothetical protein